MSTDKLVTIHDFSLMSGISAASLRHYDKLGLLIPTYRGNENNYRFYSTGQIGLGCLIETLRNLDIPLPQIKEYIANYTPTMLMDILITKSQKIDQQILHSMRLKHVINDLIFTVSNVCNFETPSVRIIPLEANSLYVSDYRINNIHEWPSAEKTNFIKTCRNNGINATTISLSYIFAAKEIQAGNYLGPARMYVKSMEGNYRIPGGLVVVSVAKYRESSLGNVFEQALDFCTNNSLEITSEFYYEMGITELMDKDPDNYTVTTYATVEYKKK